ncbi:hypothetical protein COO60DRAFT_1663389 [Scenedesmus sp. NREL 46B-D3]|nr:hypothetical protein COO60DRAFT_1663389 [Scenedesmus sp. NREL 46B-D3]
MITSSIKQISNDSPTGLQELADVVDEWGSSFGFVHTAAAFTKAANLQRLPLAAARPLLDRLAGIWDLVVPDAGAQALTNVLWACGKLQYANAQLWGTTLAASTEKMHSKQVEFVSLDVANALHGLANAAVANRDEVPGVPRAEVEAAVKQLAAHMRIIVTHPLLEGVNAQHVANTLWAFAKLRINPSKAALNSLLQALARPALLESASTQQLSNSLWAAAEVRQQCGWQPGVGQRVWERLFGEQQIRSLADRGAPTEVSNVLIALTRLSLPAAASGAASAPVIMPMAAQQCVRQLLQGKLAGDARALVASSRVAQDSRLNRGDASMLWEVHAWLVLHQLLDGQGLAGLLSEQLLAEGKAASAAYHALQEQQQEQEQQQAT